MSVFKDKEKTKDGRCWRFKVYYHNTDGKLVPYTSKRYLMEKEAKAEERAFIQNRDIPIKKRFDVVSTDYFNEAKTRIRESTYLTYLNIYNNVIKPYFDNKFIDEIKVNDINNWKDIIQKKRKASSCNQYYVVFNEIFKFANRKYELNYNPVILCGRFKNINEDINKKKSKIRYITYEQFNRFISVIDDKMYYTFFYTLYFTGMRKGEIQALTWNDIDLSIGNINVSKTISFMTKKASYKITATKTSIDRDIAMSKSLIKVLKEYKEYLKNTYNDFSENWFVFGNGDVLTTYVIERHKHLYFEKANMKNEEITIHEFRHSHVSLCIHEYIKSGNKDSTKFMLMMSQRMGHSLRVMQEVYMHLFPDTQENIVNLLDNL